MAEKKTCSICKETKSLSDFHKNKNGILGCHSACKECAYDRFIERQKEYLKEHPNIKSKICPYCKEEKDINEFGKGKYSLDGRQTYCMKCTTIKSTIYQKKHPEKSRAGNAKWCAKNYDYNIARRVKWSQDNPEKSNFNVRKALKRKAYYKTYSHQLTVDEKPIQDSKGYCTH